MKLPDYNNRLRVLVATYVTFSPNGTELLVNMGGEQVCVAAQAGSAPTNPNSASRACTYLTSTAMRQTRSTYLMVNGFTVKYRSSVASLEFPGGALALSFS